MRHNMGIANEKGLTLVEILAALVILGIVFVGFMTIFPQMTTFNEKTEEKLESINLAKVELVDIKRSPHSILNDNSSELTNTTNDYERYTSPKGKYIFETDCYRSESGKHCSEKEALEDLHKIHIKVLLQGRLISETFGYVKFD